LLLVRDVDGALGGGAGRAMVALISRFTRSVDKSLVPLVNKRRRRRRVARLETHPTTAHARVVT